MNLNTESPTYEVTGIGEVPYVDVAGTFSKENGNVALFILNRDLSKAHEIEVVWQDRTPARLMASTVLTGSDLKAFNSFDAPQLVVPQELEKPSNSSGSTKFKVRARSYTVQQWGTESGGRKYVE